MARPARSPQAAKVAASPSVIAPQPPAGAVDLVNDIDQKSEDAKALLEMVEAICVHLPFDDDLDTERACAGLAVVAGDVISRTDTIQWKANRLFELMGGNQDDPENGGAR